jgi:lipopolysaccharide/colanic/teichoic acid biosynthesis glycosyltransferase
MESTWMHENTIDLPLSYLRVRRFIDLLIIILALPVLLVLLALCCFFLFLFDKGPFFFTQERVGRNSKMFTLYKLRTMVVNCSADQLTSANDARVTAVGHFLRKYKLDELPQLLNVLKGDMSMIGPRPVPAQFYQRYLHAIPNYDLRHIVTPGITGLAQVKLGYTETMAGEMEKLQWDIQYIKSISFGQDLKILFQTFWPL